MFFGRMFGGIFVRGIVSVGIFLLNITRKNKTTFESRSEPKGPDPINRRRDETRPLICERKRAVRALGPTRGERRGP